MYNYNTEIARCKKEKSTHRFLRKNKAGGFYINDLSKFFPYDYNANPGRFETEENYFSRIKKLLV